MPDTTSNRKLMPCLLLLCCLASGTSPAQDVEQGRQAYIDGEYATALDILEPLAESGNAEAQKLLGIMYDYGHGVDRDKQAALDWYIKSAEQGDAAVQYQVGAKYFRGDGIGRDYPEAAHWWQMAADGSQVDAQFNLGLMYFRGQGVEQDDGRAADLFAAAAGQGHAQAQYSLAVMYSFGRGVEKSYPQALKWYRQAADSGGVAQAQYNLGMFYENGYGVERDTEQAANWYERAAAQGLARADTRLAALQEAETTATSPAQPPVRESDTDMPEAADDHSASAPASTGGIRREAWVLQQDADSYTLQLASVTREDDIIEFLMDHGVESEAAYIEVVIEGVTRYNGLYGNYADYAEAEQAARQLAQSLDGVEPWVRNLGILQNMLR